MIFFLYFNDLLNFTLKHCWCNLSSILHVSIRGKLIFLKTCQQNKQICLLFNVYRDKKNNWFHFESSKFSYIMFRWIGLLFNFQIDSIPTPFQTQSRQLNKQFKQSPKLICIIWFVDNIHFDQVIILTYK